MTTVQSVQTDAKKIAGDVATVGASISAILALVVNLAPSVHLPAAATAIIVSASTVVATVVAEARRIARAKKVVK